MARDKRKPYAWAQDACFRHAAPSYMISGAVFLEAAHRVAQCLAVLSGTVSSHLPAKSLQTTQINLTTSHACKISREELFRVCAFRSREVACFVSIGGSVKSFADITRLLIGQLGVPRCQYRNPMDPQSAESDSRYRLLPLPESFRLRPSLWLFYTTRTCELPLVWSQAQV